MSSSDNKPSHGRKPNQKMKPYLVYQYLLRNTDENHFSTAEDIVYYLTEIGIPAEKQSIYRDIKEINKALWLMEYETDLCSLENAIDDGSFEEEKAIVYDPHKKGFHITHRKYDMNDIRLISECIFSSKYISQEQADFLVSIMKEFISDKEAETIRTNALAADRVRTLNTDTMNNIALINDAMSTKLNGEPHIPEKISFKYCHYTIDNINTMVERTQGKIYTVNPFLLLSNDGHYYLRVYSDKYDAMTTYRVDRMKDVKLTGIPRVGDDAFRKDNTQSITQRTFGMFSQERSQRVCLKCKNNMLDTVLDRFGRDNVIYKKADDNHFFATPKIDVSDMFFGWVCGLGGTVIIESPQGIKEQFIAYLDKMKSYYSEEQS